MYILLPMKTKFNCIYRIPCISHIFSMYFIFCSFLFFYFLISLKNLPPFLFYQFSIFFYIPAEIFRQAPVFPCFQFSAGHTGLAYWTESALSTLRVHLKFLGSGSYFLPGSLKSCFKHRNPGSSKVTHGRISPFQFTVKEQFPAIQEIRSG